MDYKLLGEEPDDWASRWVASTGDVDGDGLDDLLIGAYLNDAAGENAGRPMWCWVRVWAAIGESCSRRQTMCFAERRQGWRWTFGASAGDVDGDGLADILVGPTQRCHTDAGALLIWGPTGSERCARGMPTISFGGSPGLDRFLFRARAISTDMDDIAVGSPQGMATWGRLCDCIEFGR